MNKNHTVRTSLRTKLKFYKRINWNIGTVIFLAIFLYMIVSVIMYLTSDHISSYQVTAGPLSKNETCTALVMRQEQVVKATTNGYISFFTRNSSKVRKNGIVYGIGSSQMQIPTRELDEDDLDTLRTKLLEFSRYYDSSNFSSVYDFKYILEENLLDYSGLTSSQGSSMSSDGMMLVTSATDGIVVFATDEMENLTAEAVTSEDFEQKNYKKTVRKTGDQIQAGDPVYKLITDEQWSILIPVSDKQAVRLESKEQIKVKFLIDGASETGALQILTVDGQRYAQVTFSSGMLRYINERYLEVELVTNTKSGLKIPVSSIVEKEFYKIPSELWVENDDNTAGLRREIRDKDGKTTTEFITATVYARETSDKTGTEYCYLDTEVLKDGDILVNAKTNLRYTVSERGTLEGVYCMNKGYAVFRKIVIIDQNEEYCIVESGTKYGIAQFDYIVLDGSTVREKEIFY